MRLESSQPVGDLTNSKAFDVTKLEQFVVRTAKLLLAPPQGGQIEFRLVLLGMGNGPGKSVQQLLARGFGRFRLCLRKLHNTSFAVWRAQEKKLLSG